MSYINSSNENNKDIFRGKKCFCLLVVARGGRGEQCIRFRMLAGFRSFSTDTNDLK